MVRVRDWQDGSLTSRPDHLWPELWTNHMEEACQAEGEAEVV